jgi:antitoxin component YwqK of YwqJK toxin-antitoxin module
MRIFYEKGQRVRVEQDWDGDGKPDRVARFEPGAEHPSRVEQDTNRDGVLDAFVTLRDGKELKQELDTNGDGRVNEWLELGPDGQVVERRTDRDGDGVGELLVSYRDGEPIRQVEYLDGNRKPKRIVVLEGGTPREVEEDTNEDGCLDHKQVYTADGILKEDVADTDGNCKYDTWSYFEDGTIARKEIDTNQNGIVDSWIYYEGDRKRAQAEARGRALKPNILFVFAEDGERIVTQEEDRNVNGRPDRLTRFSPEGQPTYRCTIRQEVSFLDGQPARVLDDSTGDGFADRRQIYEQGELVWVEADTNGDRRPDVWLRYEGGVPKTQDEDSDYDGRIDQRFDLATEEALPLETPVEPESSEKFGKIRCTGFSELWWR